MRALHHPVVVGVLAVATVAALAGAASATGGDGGAQARVAAAVPPATATPIRHFVTLLQENHSFDNYFGNYPGADGIPPGACVPVDPAEPSAEPCVAPFALRGQGSPRLSNDQVVFDHSYDGGKLDGFVSAQSRNGVTEKGAMGYYGPSDIPFYWNLARRYALFDAFFSSSTGGTLWNHLAWMTGGMWSAVGQAAPARERVPVDGFDAITIFDRLQESGVSWKIYVQNYDPSVNISHAGSLERVQLARVPVLAMPRFVDDPALMAHVVPLDEYYSDLAANRLPAVSYVVPSGASEHPPSRLRSGQLMVSSMIGALQRSPAWASSAFLVSYDDSGGWYDHVAPPAVGDTTLGFRVPAILVSPYVGAGVVDHTPLETASIPSFVVQNWGLAPLPSRPSPTGSLQAAFDFHAAPRPAQVVPFDIPEPAVPPVGRGHVYPLYGAAAVLGAVVFVAAFATERRHRRAQPVTVAPSAPGAPPQPDRQAGPGRHEAVGVAP